MGLANLEGACDVQSLSLFELWQPRSHCMCVLGLISTGQPVRSVLYKIITQSLQHLLHSAQ